jgi:hypothetical protein
MKLSFPFEYVHRPTVAQALGPIGPDAKDAVPVLLKAMKDGNQELQRRAAEALKKIDPEAARKAAVKTGSKHADAPAISLCMVPSHKILPPTARRSETLCRHARDGCKRPQQIASAVATSTVTPPAVCFEAVSRR